MPLFVPHPFIKPRFVLLLMLIACVCAAGPASAQQQQSRYEELMASEGAAATVRSFAMMVLAMPLQRANIEARMRPLWWASNPELVLSDAEYELAMSDLVTQCDEVERVAGKHKLRKISLAGFSIIGTQRNLDLYYAADSNAGPILFRLSVSFMEGQMQRLHGLAVFEGFDAARDAADKIQHHSGKRVASYTITPDGEDAGDKGEEAEEAADDAG